MPELYTNELKKENTQSKKNEREQVGEVLQWVSQRVTDASPHGERGESAVWQQTGSDNDSLFSFIHERHLQEAKEFRHKGYNSQEPEVDPRLMTQLHEAVAAAKSRILLQTDVEGPLGSRWLWEQIKKIERFTVLLSNDRLRDWVRHELPGKRREGAEEASLGNRSRAQSLVRRLESTLQTLIRVVDTLCFIDAYSTPAKQHDILVAELTNAFSSSEERTVMKALERMMEETEGSAAWSSLMRARASAWESDKPTTFGAMSETTRYEAEKTHKKARDLLGDAQAFFRDIAAYLQSLSSDLAKVEINVSQSAVPLSMPNEVAAPLSRSHSFTQRFKGSLDKKKSQLGIVAAGGQTQTYRIARTLTHGHLTHTPSKAKKQVLVDSIIRSVLWQWQQSAIKIQYASSALLSKVDELKTIEGMLSSYAVAHDKGATQEGSDTSVGEPEGGDMAAQVRKWVNSHIEQAKPENQQTEKMTVLNKLLDADIVNARELVVRLGNTEESNQEMLKQQRFSVLKMIVTRSGFSPFLKEVDKLLPDIAKGLTESIAALDKAVRAATFSPRDFTEAKKQAKYAQLRATEVKEKISAESARLTERPLNEYSRGSRLAKHWATLAKEQNQGHYPSLDADQVLSSLEKRGLLEGSLSTGDPKGYLFATRLAGELENAHNDELRLPMSPEQYAALEKGLIEHIVKWGQRKISQKGVRIVIELAFEQALSTVTLSISNLYGLPIKIGKALIKIPYSVHKVNSHTMPGNDKPYKAIYGMLGKKLKQLGFNLITTPMPGVVKLMIGAGVSASAVLYNSHVRRREATFSAVYERVAEGKQSEKIKMDSLSGMLLDSAVAGATTSALKEIRRDWKSDKSEGSIVSDKEYSHSQTPSDKEAIDTPHGAKLVLIGDRYFRSAVREHVEELQKHSSGRAVLTGLEGRSIEILPALHEDLLRTEDSGRSYFGSRVVGNSIYFDPFNTYYGVSRSVDIEAWRDLDPSIVLFHELMHIYEGDSQHDAIVPSDPTRLDENDYRTEFYESRNSKVVKRHLSEYESNDSQYSSVRKQSKLSKIERHLLNKSMVEDDIQKALAWYESKPVSDIESAIFLDEYLYDKWQSTDTGKLKYKRQWLKIRSELYLIDNKLVRRYLKFRMVIETYDLFKGRLLKSDMHHKKRKLVEDVSDEFKKLNFNRYNPSSMDINKDIDDFERFISLRVNSNNKIPGGKDFTFFGRVGRRHISSLYFHYANNGVEGIDSRYLQIINSYFPNDVQRVNGKERPHLNIISLINVLEDIQKKHINAYHSVKQVKDLISILSVNGKTSETLLLDSRVIAAQVYDGISNVSLDNDRIKWLKRYDNIKSNSSDDTFNLLQIESIIYYLQKNNSEGFFEYVEGESGIKLLSLLHDNTERELKKILHVDNEEYSSYVHFKTRAELGYNSDEYHSQFDNYVDNQDAEKEAKSQFLGIASYLQLSTGELFDKVEDVKVLGYAYKNRNGGSSKTAPGRVIIIKVAGGDAFVISNFFHHEHASRISKDAYHRLSPIFTGGDAGNIVHSSFEGPYHYNGWQKNHTDLTRILTGMDENELSTLLNKQDIWHGYPARFSNRFPGQESVQDLTGKTLRDAIVRAKKIENNAAVSSLRSTMYSLTDWEEIGYRLLPFYEIAHRSQTDREYEIDAEQFIVDLVAVASIALPGVKNISAMIRSSVIPSILKSGLKGVALFKSLGKEVGRLGLSVSKVLGSAVYELVEPFPIDSHLSRAAVSSATNTLNKSKLFWSDWIDNNPMINSVHPDVDGVYKVISSASEPMQDYSYFIKKDNDFYPVKYDKANRTWRLVPPEGSGSSGYSAPVRRNENGEWEPHLDVGLKGGGLPELLEKLRSKKKRPGSSTESAAVNSHIKHKGQSEPEPLIESIIASPSKRALSQQESTLIQEIKEELKDNVENYETYIMNPRENCANAAVDVSKALRGNNFKNVKIVELGLWPNGGVETMPNNHYVVMAKKDGVDIVVDLTAGQFENQYGFIGPIISTKDDWIYQWQQNLGDKPRLLVKIAPLGGGISTSPFSLYYTNPQQFVPEGFLLKRPDWYKKGVEPSVISTIPTEPSPQGAIPKQPSPQGAIPKQPSPQGAIPTEPSPQGAIPKQPSQESSKSYLDKSLKLIGVTRQRFKSLIPKEPSSKYYRGDIYPLSLPKSYPDLDERLSSIIKHTSRTSGSAGEVQSFTSDVYVARRFARSRGGRVYEVNASEGMFMSAADIIYTHGDRLVKSGHIRGGTLTAAIGHFLDDSESEYFWVGRL